MSGEASGGAAQGPRTSRLVAALAAVLVGGFVSTSALLSLLPAFRFESQFPALLPFFAWGAAAGVGHLANLGRGLLRPWRSAHGIASVVPYVVVMLVSAAAPYLTLPWWLAVVVAVAAMAPFVMLAARAGDPVTFTPAREADEASRRGTFLIGLALMLVVYAVAGSVVSGAVVAVLLAVGLGVASMRTHGLARASRTWGLGHWAALSWGSLVAWASVIVHGTTDVFAQWWWLLAAVVLAGAPLMAVDAAGARRQRSRPRAS